MSDKRKQPDDVARYADMFAAIGAEPRLRIVRLLLTAHPEGLNVGEIQEELAIPNSTLSRHLEKLKSEELVTVRREGTFLRYLANTEVLQQPRSRALCTPPNRRGRFRRTLCGRRSVAATPQRWLN